VIDMTELVELVHIGIVDEKKLECPFHEKSHKCDDSVENKITDGNAETLGERLADGEPGSSTVKRTDKPYINYKMPEKSADPDKIPPNKRLVKIFIHDETLLYPVAYSAHHLIPAKESMKPVASLHKFIDSSEGKICCNLGYDINGNENGVWLPGLHAVNSKGIGKWGSADEECPDEESVRTGAKQIETGKKDFLPLDGPRPADANPSEVFSDDNMKWLYVQAAMQFDPGDGNSPRQFHDRHPTYSQQVEGKLTAMAKLLEHLYGLQNDANLPGCPDCKKSRQQTSKPPPPARLLSWLNNLSRWCRDGKLLGHTEDTLYYTSSWCCPGTPSPAPKTPKKKSVNWKFT
jgi:hypothetical protein